VGAAIAAGNHAENGIWALFVIAAKMSTIEPTTIPELLTLKFVKLKSPTPLLNEIVSKMATSPKRLVSAVNILAL